MNGWNLFLHQVGKRWHYTRGGQRESICHDSRSLLLYWTSIVSSVQRCGKHQRQHPGGCALWVECKHWVKLTGTAVIFMCSIFVCICLKGYSVFVLLLHCLFFVWCIFTMQRFCRICSWKVVSVIVRGKTYHFQITTISYPFSNLK